VGKLPQRQELDKEMPREGTRPTGHELLFPKKKQ